MRFLSLRSLLCMSACLVGCARDYRNDLDYDYDVIQTWQIEDISSHEIVQFESVFWEPDDTVSLRKLITKDNVAAQRDCLEIGTGTGLLSILCLRHDATKVVATDINRAAVANARYNAAMIGVDQNLEVRQVDPASPGAFAVIKDNEQFDLIISNPPWENGSISKPADHAYYDPNFALMDSLLDGLPAHLRIDGRCLLAYGHRPAIERLLQGASDRNYVAKILDDRSLNELPTNFFLPGMLVEIRCPAAVTASPTGTASTAPND